MNFNEWYSKYPRKCARRAAEKAWNGLIRQGVKPERIEMKLRDRLESWCRRKEKYIPYPATFLRAESFDDDDCEASVDDKEVLPLFRQPHWCPMCPIAHSWDCQDHPLCGLSYEVCCQEFTAKLRKRAE
jgi:hypothetical protein